MKGPERSAFRVEAGDFQRSFDCGVSWVHLRGESANTSVAGMSDECFEQGTAHAAIPPGMLDEHFHQVHRLTAIFRSPLVACIRKAA